MISESSTPILPAIETAFSHMFEELPTGEE